MTAQLSDEKGVAEQSFNEVYETGASLRGSVISEDKGIEDGALNGTAANTRFEAERRLLRKLDMRFMPTIVLIYIMNYIDVSILVSRCEFFSTLRAEECHYDSPIEGS